LVQSAASGAMERRVHLLRRMRVAFATTDCEHVDEQFRRASHLVVFDVTAESCELHRVFAFPPEARVRTDDQIRAILGTSIVFVSAIGPSQAVRLAGHGIRPFTVRPGASISSLLSQLARSLASGAPAWSLSASIQSV
jgi:nitrogen fixation protein NifX